MVVAIKAEVRVEVEAVVVETGVVTVVEEREGMVEAKTVEMQGNLFRNLAAPLQSSTRGPSATHSMSALPAAP